MKIEKSLVRDDSSQAGMESKARNACKYDQTNNQSAEGTTENGLLTDYLLLKNSGKVLMKENFVKCVNFINVLKFGTHCVPN